MAKDKKAEYAVPTDQAELKERLDNGFESDRVLDDGEAPDDVPGYVGVDPIYQNAANKTEEPYRSEDGPQADLEQELLGDDETEHEDDEEDEEEPPASTGSSSSGSATQNK